MNMVKNKPTILNAPGVYNLGGGGGGGGGASIPDFLQPVEWARNNENTWQIVMPYKRTFSYSSDSFGIVISNPTSNTGLVRSYPNLTVPVSSSNSLSLEYRNDNTIWMYNDGSQVTAETATGIVNTEKVTFYAFKNTAYVHDESGHNWQMSKYSGSGTYPIQMLLFGCRTLGTTSSCSNAKIYEFWIKDGNGDKVCDVIPCRHKQTNEMYLLELFTGVFAFDLSNVSPNVDFGPDITIE